MNGAFYVAATGLNAQERALQVVANNIANINTPAFKRSEARFSQILAAPDTVDDLLATAPAGTEALGGVRLDTSRTIFTQGDLKHTGDPTHIAVKGDGFIELIAPSGETLLWRGGTLSVGPDGFLAAGNGMPLKAMISVPLEAGGLTISADGQVSAQGLAQGADLGRIDLVRGKDENALKPAGDGLYESVDPSSLVSASPGEDGAGVLVQGAIESANVELSDEMVLLLLTQRAFAANAQVLQAGDQLMAIANGLKR